MQINNKTIAVVTGGASGLGAASARALAKAGAQVTIFDMDAAQGEAVAAEISGQFQQVDVSDAAQVAGAMVALEARGNSSIPKPSAAIRARANCRAKPRCRRN